MNELLRYLGWRRSALKVLQRDGIVRFPPLAPEQMTAIFDHLEKRELISAPWFFEVCLSMYDIAKMYFKTEPLLWSLEQCEPDSGDKKHSWQYVGIDTAKKLYVLVYGSDVNVSGDGALMYRKGLYRGGGEMETIIGPAGTMTVFDPYGEHMYLRSAKDQLLLIGLWTAGVPDPLCFPAPQPFSREILGMRYPKSPILQKAVEPVIR